MSASRATPPSKDDFTVRIEAALIDRIGSQRYHLWFQHTAFVPMGRELLLAVPTEHTQDWLQRTFGDAIRSAVAEVFGRSFPIRYVVDEALFEDQPKDSTTHDLPNINKSKKPDSKDVPTDASRPQKFAVPNVVNTRAERLEQQSKPSSVRPRPDDPASRRKSSPRRFRSLSDFVVGPCNRVAYASALSVVEEPALGSTCLVLHGPVGTGKTHLLEGIYAGLRKKWPEMPITFVTAEDFTARFVQASRFQKQAAFRRQFRDCGVLLLDDLHFLVGKKITQEEFLYTFDALASDGKQIVLTMDCHPRYADEFMPELRDRLLGSAIWNLMPPDQETRLAILRKKATGATSSIPDDVLQHLGKHLNGNVRELEGAVNSLKHYAKVLGQQLTVSHAREALGDLLRHSVRTISLADIDYAVRTVLNLNGGALQSKSRSWMVTRPRMVAIYLARKHTSSTYAEIAKFFGVKTHSTPVAAEKKVRTWLETEESLPFGERSWKGKDLIERIERELQR